MLNYSLWSVYYLIRSEYPEDICELICIKQT